MSCLQCGAALRQGTMYCSRACRGAAQRQPRTYNCQTCGIAVTKKTASEAKRSRYICRSCNCRTAAFARASKRTGVRVRHVRKQPRITIAKSILCAQCGTKFYAYASGAKKFCSQKCNGLSRVGKPSLHRQGNCNKHFGGIRVDLGGYFRSRWEANYARFLRSIGMEYFYEPAVFLLRLEDGKLVSYRPDFRVGMRFYVEIKGWFRPTRREADIIRAAQSQLPLPLHVISEEEYRRMEKAYAAQIEGWEYRGDPPPEKPRKMCEGCGKRVTSIFKRTRYCSIKCYSVHRPKESFAALIEGGKKSRKVKGQEPWNKGKPYPAALKHGRYVKYAQAPTDQLSLPLAEGR